MCLLFLAYSPARFFRKPAVAPVWCGVGVFRIVRCFFVLVIYYINVYEFFVLCVRCICFSCVGIFLRFFYLCDMPGRQVVAYVFVFFVCCFLVKKLYESLVVKKVCITFALAFGNERGAALGVLGKAGVQ